MAKPLIPIPLKTKDEFKNDSEYIKYCKKRYQQRTNYDYRLLQKKKAMANIGGLCLLLSN